jgi:hypothetical protein
MTCASIMMSDAVFQKYICHGKYTLLQCVTQSLQPTLTRSVKELTHKPANATKNRTRSVCWAITFTAQLSVYPRRVSHSLLRTLCSREEQ